MRFNLQFTFIKNVYISIFFILKILTDFRKTVETGMDPRLVVIIVHTDWYTWLVLIQLQLTCMNRSFIAPFYCFQTFFCRFTESSFLRRNSSGIHQDVLLHFFMILIGKQRLHAWMAQTNIRQSNVANM